MCVCLSFSLYRAVCFLQLSSPIQTKSPYNTIKTIFLTVLYLIAGSSLFRVAMDEKTYKGESETKGAKGDEYGRWKRGKETTTEEENVREVCMEGEMVVDMVILHTHRHMSIENRHKPRATELRQTIVRERQVPSSGVDNHSLPLL